MEEMIMKMNRLAIMALAALLPLTSCLKDQADVFEEPSSARMQNYLENVRTQLQGSEKGWVLSYYPGSAYATTYFVLNFTGQQVTAVHQGDPETAATSYYKLAADDGAVLSFDTYNKVLHYYATPDSGHYQARGGDFEFDIMDVTPDRIVLLGKRSRNYCYLDRMTQTKEAFFEEVAAAEKNLDLVAFAGTVSNGAVEGFLDMITHTLSIGRKDAEASEMVSARYMVTKGGLHINEPFTFQGVTFQDFSYDSEKGILTGSGIQFTKVIPEGYVSYKDYLGKYNFVYYSGQRNFQVELVEKDPGATFVMKGFSTYFEPEISYNAARGYLNWKQQVVGSANGLTVILAGWAYPAGSSLWPVSTPYGTGMYGIVEDTTIPNFQVNFSDNGALKDNGVDGAIHGWVLWGLDGGGNSAGSFDSWTTATGSNQVPGDIYMTKIVE